MKAFITGITGQDGPYLAEFLLNRGYEVYGGYRRTSTPNFWRLEYLHIENHPKLHLVEYDLLDPSAAIHLISKIEPDEIYNLAAQSFVSVSFQQPLATSQITGTSVINLLEAIRIINPKIKFYQASTSEMYGKIHENPQTETTVFHPRSPYGVSKLFAHWITINYRESYDIFASCGILFNHESPLRGIEFVTRKITDSVSKIHLNQLDCIELGNLDAQRDWGYAREYVEGMYLMLQHNVPDTYVLATNKTYSVRDFLEMSLKSVDINIEWIGKNENEKGINKKTGKSIVKINPKYYRPCEVELLRGNAEKAKSDLGWEYKTSVEDLCKIMVEADISRNKK